MEVFYASGPRGNFFEKKMFLKKLYESACTHFQVSIVFGLVKGGTRIETTWRLFDANLITATQSTPVFVSIFITSTDTNIQKRDVDKWLWTLQKVKKIF